MCYHFAVHTTTCKYQWWKFGCRYRWWKSTPKYLGVISFTIHYKTCVSSRFQKLSILLKSWRINSDIMEKISITSMRRGEHCLIGEIYGSGYRFPNGSCHYEDTIENIASWLEEWFTPLAWQFYYQNPSSYRLDLVREAILISDGAIIRYNRTF